MTASAAAILEGAPEVSVPLEEHAKADRPYLTKGGFGP